MNHQDSFRMQFYIIKYAILFQMQINQAHRNTLAYLLHTIISRGSHQYCKSQLLKTGNYWFWEDMSDAEEQTTSKSKCKNC